MRSLRLALTLCAIACGLVPTLALYAEVDAARKHHAPGLYLIGAVTLSRSRYSRPAAQLAGSYAANLYTQANGVTFSTVTGQFTKANWYFGAVPTHRYAAATATPATAGALTSALAALSGVDNPIIELTVGNTYAGAFHIPAKVWTGTLVLRSGALAGIPVGINGGSATRVGPGHAASMAQLTTTGGTAALHLNGGAQDVWIEGVEVYTSHDAHGILAGTTTNGATTAALVPQRTAFVHCYSHLNPATSPAQNVRGLYNETQDTLAADNYISGWRCTGSDPGAYLALGYGEGRQDIVNNYLEGAGENVLFGGGDTLFGGVEVWHKDIFFANNHVYTPSAWKGAWTKKNLFEIKKGERFTVVGNIFDGCWVSGQTGEAWAIKNANQSGANVLQMSQDHTFRYNIVRNAGSLVQLVTSGDVGVTTGLHRVEIRDTLAYDLNSPTYNGNDPLFCLFAPGAHCSVPSYDWSLTHNTLSAVNSPNKAMETDSASGPIRPYIDRLTIRDNIYPRGTYGVIGTGSGEGTAAMTSRWTNYNYDHNVMHGSGAPAKAGSYPAGNFFESNETAVNYTDVAGDNYRIVAATAYAHGGAGKPSDDAAGNAKDQGCDISRVLAETATVV